MWQAPERVPIPQLQHPAQLATPSRVQCRYSVVKEHKMRRITRPVAHKLAQRGHVQQATPVFPAQFHDDAHAGESCALLRGSSRPLVWASSPRGHANRGSGLGLWPHPTGVGHRAKESANFPSHGWLWPYMALRP